MARKRNAVLDFLAFVPQAAFLGIVHLLPWRARLATGAFVLRSAVALLPDFRRRIEGNLRLIFPAMPADARRRIRFAVADNFGRSFVETFSARDFQRRAPWGEPAGPGWEALQAARAAGEGVILVGGHFGQWEAVRGALKARGIEVGALYRPMNNPWLERTYLRNMSEHGAPMLPRGAAGMRELIRHLRGGGVVAILLDQYVVDGRPIDFLGHPAPAGTAIAALAHRFKVPMIPAYGTRQPDGVHIEIDFEAPLPAEEPRGDDPGRRRQPRRARARDARPVLLAPPAMGEALRRLRAGLVAGSGGVRREAGHDGGERLDRQDQQHSRAVEREAHRAGRAIRGADPSVGREGETVDRPAQALGGDAAHRCHREERERNSRAEADRETPGAEQAEPALAQQHDLSVGVLRERVHRGELVVEPAAEEAHADEERRLDRIEALLEVGGILLREAMDRDPCPLEARGILQRIEVADDGADACAARQRHVAAAVGGDGFRRQRKGGGEMPPVDRTAADQRYWGGEAVEGAGCQSRTTTAETLFFGDPSMSLSE